LRSVVVDANVFVSFFIERNEAQRIAARAFIAAAEDGEIAAILPQFILFEVAYVLQSQYGVTGERLASVVLAILAFPGVHVIDDCPWKRVMGVWPNPLPSLADAAVAAIALTNRYDAVATFDRKLAKRLVEFGVAAYW
jgi:predicted nucleic acid-binding protein